MCASSARPLALKLKRPPPSRAADSRTLKCGWKNTVDYIPASFFSFQNCDTHKNYAGIKGAWNHISGFCWVSWLPGRQLWRSWPYCWPALSVTLPNLKIRQIASWAGYQSKKFRPGALRACCARSSQATRTLLASEPNAELSALLRKI